MVTTTRTVTIGVVHQLSFKLKACGSKLLRTLHESQGGEIGMEAVILRRKQKQEIGRAGACVRGTGGVRKAGAEIQEVTHLQVQEDNTAHG